MLRVDTKAEFTFLSGTSVPMPRRGQVLRDAIENRSEPAAMKASPVI
jgi:hypothetical protein